jgi:hypothetical protein
MMWLRCPRQWEFRYVKGLKIPTPAMVLLGTAYHGALETNFKYKLERKEDLPLVDVLDAFATCWERRLIPVPQAVEGYSLEEIDWEGYEPGEVKDKGIQLVKAYRQSIAPRINPKDVELRIEKATGGVSFIGSIDLIDESGLVIDHKTSYRSKSQGEAERDLQPSAYAYLLDKPLDFEFHVALRTGVPGIQRIGTKRTRQDIEWYLEMVKLILFEMKTGIAPPNPTSYMCSPKWCGYWNLCRRN